MAAALAVTSAQAQPPRKIDCIFYPAIWGRSKRKVAPKVNDPAMGPLLLLRAISKTSERAKQKAATR